jgi:hypothetical protein
LYAAFSSLHNVPNAYNGSGTNVSDKSAAEFLSRHQSGDWGLVCEDDRLENELPVKEGFRILSSRSQLCLTISIQALCRKQHKPFHSIT